ncbi:hypothetical protein GOP47_0009958 [Adiantum capillus-veneris]|uniref:DYW domain-containing protein n=1 Tax=Adiantum capillus-veneris TaxID=13818 RepID=A0A9D4UYR0_ADICA|nr:hypothetical protein GOP47_0009958 [Adiantum capillus-veneris]
MAATIHQLPSSGMSKEDRKISRSKDFLWKEFFRDPSKWRDYREGKSSPNYPDFKLEATGEPLWMDSWRNPSWVHGELRRKGFIQEECQGSLRREHRSREPCRDTPSSEATEGNVKMENCCHPSGVSGSLGFTGHDTYGQLLSCEAAEEDRMISPSVGLLSTEFSRISSKRLRDCDHNVILRNRDSKHKVAGDPLWMNSWGNSSGVEGELRIRGFLREPYLDNASTTQVDLLVASLRICTRKKDLVKGTRIHHDLVQRQLVEKCSDALVTMYAKCGELVKAKTLLDSHKSKDVITWTALITGYARGGQGQSALDCLDHMQREGVLPDAVTYASALKACATLRAADRGKHIHEEIARQGMLQNCIVVGTALVDMYAKCGILSEARRVLEELPSRNVVSWSALVAGYAQEGETEQALNCLEQMRREGIAPNAVTYISTLKACGTIRDVKRGRHIHNEIKRQGLLQNNLTLGNALVDMYAKCGDVSEAHLVLKGLPARDVISWNTLIAGYAHEGRAEQALNCLEKMQHEGILPDAVTCASVLNVCSHLGLVEEGQVIFENMTTKYGVKPSLECYTCMIDLIGRAGHLQKAVRLIQDMPSSDYIFLWHALMGACQKWVDVHVGRWAFEQAVKLDGSEGSTYVLMANIYAEAGMEEEAKSIEAMRIRNKAWKKPGCSWWTDSSNVAHKFSVGDTKHAEDRSINVKLEEISHKLWHHGHSESLHRMSQNILSAAKSHLLCRHSEMLALACALTNAPQRDTIHITKDMGICGDCHVVISIISKIEVRTIVVTDTAYCHRFENGKCSCTGFVQ